MLEIAPQISEFWKVKICLIVIRFRRLHERGQIKSPKKLASKGFKLILGVLVSQNSSHKMGFGLCSTLYCFPPPERAWSTESGELVQRLSA